MTSAPPIDGTSEAERATRRLRRVLLANASTSFVTGTVGLVAAPWWSERLGLGSVGWTRLVAAGLIVFAIDVALLAVRGQRSVLRTGTFLVSVADAGWVVATLVALAVVEFTASGRIVAVAIAVVVLDFALLQVWLRRTLD